MSDKKISTEFMSFRLREVIAKDNREPGPKMEKSGAMEFLPEISFGCLDDEKKAPFTIVIHVRLSAILKKARATVKTPPSVQAVVEGEATYKLSGVSLTAYRKLFDNNDFLDRLADQSYPLVSYKMDRLLSEMGFGVEFPLSLPEIVSRTHTGDLVDADVPSEKNVLSRKGKASSDVV